MKKAFIGRVPQWLALIGAALIFAATLIGRVPAHGQDMLLAAGPWAGEASYTVDGIRHTAAIQFTVAETGQVTDGAIRLVFTFPGISPEVLDLMNTHGCAVMFNEMTTSSRPVAGLFASATEGVGTFAALACSLEGFGELQFASPVIGTWNAVAETAAETTAGADGGQVSAGGGLTVAANGAAMLSDTPEFPHDPPTHENDTLTGRDLYKLYCDECHAQKGLGSEKAPPLEGLNAVKIATVVRDGPEDMDVFTHEELPDRQLNVLIDYVLKFNPASTLRTQYVITPPTTE